MTRRRDLRGLLLGLVLLACLAGLIWIDVLGDSPIQVDDPLIVDDPFIVDDPLVTKYRWIHVEMKYEEAVRLLGQPVDQMHPGVSLGDHIYYWSDKEGEETLMIRWDCFGDFVEKSLAVDGTVRLREKWRYKYLRDLERAEALREAKPWWKKLLRKLGF